jgi:hypothetical protein
MIDAPESTKSILGFRKKTLEAELVAKEPQPRQNAFFAPPKKAPHNSNPTNHLQLFSPNTAQKSFVKSKIPQTQQNKRNKNEI